MSTACSLASLMGSTLRDARPSYVATSTNVTTLAAAASLQKATVPSRSTVHTLPSVRLKLRTPRADTAARAPSHTPAIVAGLVTPPHHTSAPACCSLWAAAVAPGVPSRTTARTA